MFRKLLALAAFALSFSNVGTASEAEVVTEADLQKDYAEETYQGIVREVDLEASTITVSGWLFKVPMDTPVTVRGSHGALSMLAEGMQVDVSFRQKAEDRLALAIDQLPDNQEVLLH